MDSFYIPGLSQTSVPAPVSVPAERPADSPAQRLYAALAVAETGGEKDPFIRTKVAPKAGSTAYGPVQITGTLVRDYVKRRPGLFDEDELEYAKRMIDQSDKFAKFGRNPQAKGYDARFDYGGAGELGQTPEDRDMYARVATKLIDAKWRESGGNLQQFIKAWRGVPAQQDPGYFKKVQAMFSAVSSPNVST